MSKICEIMGFGSIFGKGVMKNARLPKISVLVQFGGGILTPLCSGDSIQSLACEQALEPRGWGKGRGEGTLFPLPENPIPEPESLLAGYTKPSNFASVPNVCNCKFA